MGIFSSFTIPKLLAMASLVRRVGFGNGRGLAAEQSLRKNKNYLAVGCEAFKPSSRQLTEQFL